MVLSSRRLAVFIVLGVAAAYVSGRARHVDAPVARVASGGRPPAARVAPTAGATHVAAVAARVGTRPLDRARRFVSGRVLTEGRRPIARARICAVDVDAACCAAPVCTFSNGDGEFSLAADGDRPATLHASHEGFLPVTRLAVDSRDTPLVITMVTGGAKVTGAILDVAGGPIVGAEVTASDEARRFAGWALSDDAGRFHLIVAEGTTHLRVRADGYADADRVVQAPLAGLELSLAAQGAIVGRVVSEDTGSPVGAVTVTGRARDGFPPFERAVQSLDDGTFRLSGLRPGRYGLEAVSESWRGEEHPVPVELADTVESVELVVRRATRLIGEVLFGPSPCPRASVTLRGPVSNAARADSSGNVVFDGLTPGAYQVSVACEGARAHERLEIGNERVRRVWRLDAGTSVAGAAVSARGLPLIGAQVDVRPVGEGGERGETHCSTDVRGEFSCSGLMPGDYEVQLGSGAQRRSERVVVHVSSEASPRVVLHAHAEGAIRVRIEDADAFDRATLSVIAKRQDGPPLLGDLRGDTVVFDPVPLGSYQVSIDAERPGVIEPVEIAHDGQVAELSLALGAPHRLHGRVVDDAGFGVPETWVYASAEPAVGIATATEPALTDEDGSFTLQGLREGRYALDAQGARGEGRLPDVASNRDDVIIRIAAFAARSAD